MNCRWAGHVKTFYSIAEHSYRVCELVQEPKLKLAALLHDAAEAYLLDMPKPFKKIMPEYGNLEHELMRVISKKFGFDYPIHGAIKIADTVQLEWEWDWLKSDKFEQSDVMQYMTPQQAELVFMKTYYELTNNV